MQDLITNLETITVVLAITAPITGVIIAYFKKKFSCIPKLARQADIQENRSIRQSKALINLSHRLDQINNHQHPDNQQTSLGEEAERILEDGEGKL